MVRCVTEEEIGRKLDLVTHGASEQFAEPTPSRPANRVEARQFDAAVRGPGQLSNLRSKATIRKGVLTNYDISARLQTA